MDNKARNKAIERGVIVSMEPFVEGELHRLIGERTWRDSDFFGFMQGNDYEVGLRQLKGEAETLQNEDLVVLAGNYVTEEALPNYARRLGNLLPDPTGVSDNAWNRWERGWEAEENMHRRVLDHYLLLTGRVDMDAVNSSSDGLITNGMSSPESEFQGLIYPAFQEPATSISHTNMAKIAKSRGADTLARICGNIAGDERRHGGFYLAVMQEMMKLEPERTLEAYAALMQSGITMPAENMTDGDSVEHPTLFQRFSAVASRIGIYTLRDYADITEKLNNAVGVAKASVGGAAQKAQDYLSELPARTRKVAERIEGRVVEPVPFAWIRGGKA
jgi:acyl-[acyl-carrier-protein] desaturase